MLRAACCASCIVRVPLRDQLATAITSIYTANGGKRHWERNSDWTHIYISPFLRRAVHITLTAFRAASFRVPITHYDYYLLHILHHYTIQTLTAHRSDIWPLAKPIAPVVFLRSSRAMMFREYEASCPGGNICQFLFFVSLLLVNSYCSIRA